MVRILKPSGHGHGKNDNGNEPAGVFCTMTTANLDLATVQSAVDGAVDGDVICLPAGSVTWTGQLSVTKAITLRGAVPALDGNGIPTSCGTVITDSHAFDTLIKFTLVSNKTSRLTGIQIIDGAVRGSSAALGVIQVQGQLGGGAQDSRRMRIDHCRFIQLNGLAPHIYAAYGIADHNYYELKSGSYFCAYFYQPAENAYSHERWHEDPNWGTDKFWYMESNKIVRASGAPFYAFVDQYSGARMVARYNDITQCWFEVHGTESSSQVIHGGRAFEVYNNAYHVAAGWGGGLANEMVNLRSGTSMVWGNTADYAVPYAVALNNNLAISGNAAFASSDGYSPWDINDAGNPFASFTASSYTALDGNQQQTVTVTGAGWTTDQWKGYHIHKTGFVPPDTLEPSGSLVLSNTSDTLTYFFINAGTHVDLPAGTAFTLNKVTHTIDVPGRGQGTLLESRYIASITTSGTTAAVTTSIAHGLSTGNYVGISDAAPCSNLNGYYQITVTDTTHFTYTVGAFNQAPSSTDTSANTCTFTTGHHFQTGTPVTALSAGGGLSTSTTYYAQRLSATVMSFHPTAVDAIFDTNRVDLTASITSVIQLGTCSFAQFTKVPAGWNDQVTEGCYQWLNTNNSGNILHTPFFYLLDIREDEHYYDYAGTLQSNPTTPFDGSTGVGVGIIANRPTSGLTVGVGYWATDEQKFYKATGTNTWALYYQPYAYPHPLIAATGS